MKKIFFVFLLCVLTLNVFTGCSQKPAAEKLIRVGVCAGPYGDMFNDAIKPQFEKAGYTVKLVEFSDYVQPNLALSNNEIDVNMFQHSVYLKNFSTEHNLQLSVLKEIPTAGMGVFSNNLKSLDEITSGATVTIPNDPTNLSRALRVLQQAGIIKINPDIDASKATEKDLSENPKELKFVLVEAPQLPRSLDSADISVINGNYALASGLKLQDALYNEQLSEGYVNVIAIRTEDEGADFAKAILDAVNSDEFKNVIENPDGQYVSFFRPEDY